MPTSKSIEMEFDSAFALEYAQQISRLRQVGSSEEKKIAEEIKTFLEELGFLVAFQPFRFSTLLETILIVEILAGLVLILTIILTLGMYPWF